MYKLIRDRKIRIAIVGCGRISNNHIGAIERHNKDIELVAVCDTDRKKLKETSDALNVPGYTMLDQLLEKENVDAVSICTPSGEEHGSLTVVPL